MLRPHLEYMQIKDALAADGTVVTAGQGDGEVRADDPRPAHDGFDGFFSLEPHLGTTSSSGGFSGPELWRQAHAGFTEPASTPRGSTMTPMSTASARWPWWAPGVIGTHHGLVLSQLADRLELVAVVDVAIDRAEKLAAERGGRPFTSLAEALAAVDVDIVVVCIPTGLHGEVAIEALDAGKHVIIEKPAEMTVAEGRRDHRGAAEGRHGRHGHLPAPLRPGHRDRARRHPARASSAG